MNKYIYNTLFKTQDRESDRRSKEIEQTKESQNIHTQTKQQGHVTLSTELQFTALINVKFPSSLEKSFLGFDNDNINNIQIAAIALATAIDHAPTIIIG